MHYGLTDLRLFVAIAEERNLTRGAARAYLAPSSASHRLRRLEETLNTSLFERQTRGVALTRAGEARRFLDPQLRDLLPDPRSLKDMERAAARFLAAVATGQRIAGALAFDGMRTRRAKAIPVIGSGRLDGRESPRFRSGPIKAAVRPD